MTAFPQPPANRFARYGALWGTLATRFSPPELHQFQGLQPDYRSSRQYVSVGNIVGDPHVSVFFIDYPARSRLKLLGRMRSAMLKESGEAAKRVIDACYGAKVERLLLSEVEAFDWNCPQYITPRYAMDEIQPMPSALRLRVSELEAALGRFGAGPAAAA